MKSLIAVSALLFSTLAHAHPGNGIVVLAGRAIIVSDSTTNTIWRFSAGSKPQRLVEKIHVHYLVQGLDGKLYAEALQERGGAWESAIFQLNDQGATPQPLSFTNNLPGTVFAVDREGDVVIPGSDGFYKLSARKPRQRLADFSSQTGPKIDVETLQAMTLASDGTIYFADGLYIRRMGKDGAITTMFTLQPQEGAGFFPPGSGKTRAWSLTMENDGKLLAAIPTLRQVVRLTINEKPAVIHQSAKGWVATGAVSHQQDVYVVEVGMEENSNQIRVVQVDKTGKANVIGTAR